MRKNQVGRKSIKGVWVVYQINGLNLDRFINIVKKRGIAMQEVKKPNNKLLIVTVSYSDSQNFFAIAKELCYNIKKVREKGKGYPLLALIRSIGLLVGAILFAISVAICDDFLFEINYSGSGAIYKRQVQEYLLDKGVTTFSRFSQINLENLEDKILADNPHLSFVALKKSGNRLLVELVLSTDKVQRLNGDVYQLVSPVDGVIESVKVYRGTAVVNSGDRVKEKDLLVDGYAVIKEQTVRINVLAVVTIKVGKEFIYRSQMDGEEEKAKLMAELSLGEMEIIDCSVEKSVENGEYVYKTTVFHRQVIYAG